MDRKSFIRKSLLAGAAASAAPMVLKAGSFKIKNSDYDKMIEQVGFNHLPNKEEKTMNTVLHKAGTRGHANHGWLDTHHTFSFANYHNPERMHFGVLRVLNDDRIAGGKGFGTHPHDNMEIITIPISGDLAHKDSMGNSSVIQEGKVQVMSAGTGIFHSEFNANNDKHVTLLQIWLFPNKKNVTPRYDEISIRDVATKNDFYQILSPNESDQGVWIHQDAWFHLADFDTDTKTSYRLNKTGNGVYVFVMEGNVKIADHDLSTRDGLGVWDIDTLNVEASTGAKVLVMEVPMTI